MEVFEIPKKGAGINNSVLISLAVSVAMGLIVGAVKYIFDDVVGFSLIIIFPLLYGFFIGYVLAMLFRKFKLQSQKMAVAFAIISITAAIGLYMFLDRAHVERLVFDYLESTGEDTTGKYLTWPGYFEIIGELGTSVGFFGRTGIDLTGMWFYGLTLFEFALMYYYAVKKVGELYVKHVEKI